MRLPLATSVAVLAVCTAIPAPALAQPLTTAFTYQGELRNAGAPASGLHDLRFRLYDAAAGGTPIGALLCSDNVALSSGRFTVTLDFGAAFAGQQRFLEVEVRPDTGMGCGSAVGFVLLTPRQELTAAPNATFALNAASATTATTATNATQLNGQGALFYQNAANLSAGTLPNGRLSGPYSGAVTFSNAANLFTGSGAGLSSLNASNIASGTLASARLPNPLSLTGSEAAGALISVTNSSPSGLGVFGHATATIGQTTGVFGQSSSPGGRGVYGLAMSEADAPAGGYGTGGESTAATGAGIYGFGNHASGANFGGYFETPSTAGTGVFAKATSTTGANYGVYGESLSSAGVGVYGRTTSTTGSSLRYGGYFEALGSVSRAVAGFSRATTGQSSGVYGETASDTDGRGVRGVATSTAATSTSTGVWGESDGGAGRGVFGYATASSGATFGGYFQSDSSLGKGVYGHSTASALLNYGGYFQNDSTSGRGVHGRASAASGTAFGVSGESASTSGRGVYGYASASSGTTWGVYGKSESPTGRGVYGESEGNIGVYGLAWPGDGANIGVYGRSLSDDGHGVKGEGRCAGDFEGTFIGVCGSSSSPGLGYGVVGSIGGTSGSAVHGGADGSTGGTFGVYGYSQSSSGTGVCGYATNNSGTTYGVLGLIGSTSGWAVYADGRLGASGTKAFRIDHPDDPENKYLLHYSTESPEVLNAYRGTVALDSTGAATVELPHYFARINKSPSYTLTAVGAPMPLLHIAEEISNDALLAGEQAAPRDAVPICSFRIAGGAPGAKVSWRIEAVRNDLWMRNRASPVEAEKEGLERGTYQHPEFYGLPNERGMSPERGYLCPCKTTSSAP